MWNRVESRKLPSDSAPLIRRYRDVDGDDVIRLFEDAMAELAPTNRRKEFQTYVHMAIDRELSRIREYYLEPRGHDFWVAETPTVVGMAGVEKSANGVVELRRMIVDREFRRRGVGGALLDHVERCCISLGYNRIVLNTSELQTAARAFYRAHGFELVNVTKATLTSHKSVGVGLDQYYFEKSLV